MFLQYMCLRKGFSIVFKVSLLNTNSSFKPEKKNHWIENADYSSK